MKPTKDQVPPPVALNLGLASSSVTNSVVHLAGPPVIHQGWVLKKRRKKMQGFARRYFTLYQSGLLSYAFEPGHPIRDQVYLHNAAISTAPGRKDIHIDSNTATFHIKCLSTEDFDAWMSAFRKFISVGIEAKKAATYRHAARQASINLTRSGVLVEEMGTSISEIDTVISTICLNFSPPKSSGAHKRPEKHHSKESMFALFKRPHHSHETGSSENVRSLSESLQDIRSKVDALKNQYAALVKMMNLQSTPHEPGQPTPSLPFTPEVEEAQIDTESKQSISATRRSFRDSIGTNASGSFVEWYDAEDNDDGPQEFFMDAAHDMSEPGSRLLSQREETDVLDTSSIDTDIEEAPLAPTQLQKAEPVLQQVIRRTHLPCLPPSDEGSLFSILKKNVGKDLSTITFPVTFNEPLTMLQRAAEEVEYFSLLEEAARALDPVSRIAYVAAFAISGYAHTKHRTGRKGFNPLLAETFEDSRMKFLAEKVRHNPLEIAYHAEGENWELSATTHGKTKFWGKSLEIIPLGNNRVKIGQDVFVWKKPSSFIRNLMVGTKYFEHTGEMAIENETNQVRCVVDFKQNGYWGPTNVVSATIYSANGNTIGQLEGKWDDKICQILDTNTLHVLWKAAPFPKTANDYYGFTYYGITLNEITDDLVGKLPPTDSRNRPDVKALEVGAVDLAEEEKLRVEQIQRDRRTSGKERRSRWFRQRGDDWEYVGGYWEARAQGWKGEKIEPLW